MMQPTLCTKANLDLTELTVRMESQLYLGRKGAREDRCWAWIPTISTDALHLFCLRKQNYISQEAVRLLSPPLPAFRLPRPAPLRDPLVYKGRMARPWQSAEAVRACGVLVWLGGRGRHSWHPPICLSLPGPLFPRGRPPYSAWALQTCKPEVESGFALGTFLGLAERFGRESGFALEMRSQGRPEAASRLGAVPARGGGMPSPGAAERPASACFVRRSPGPGMRPLGTPASGLPAISAGPERRGRLPALWPWMESEQWGGGLRTP